MGDGPAATAGLPERLVVVRRAAGHTGEDLPARVPAAPATARWQQETRWEAAGPEPWPVLVPLRPLPRRAGACRYSRALTGGAIHHGDHAEAPPAPARGTPP
ncbi:hypothetical protein [Streptomyces sp. NPDC096105]|uniref:hypothetical protein n=1 Tax=Streptomyces sp. NPDC096105 TaxID=3366074 RepID=UPI003803DA67